MKDNYEKKLQEQNNALKDGEHKAKMILKNLLTKSINNAHKGNGKDENKNGD